MELPMHEIEGICLEKEGILRRDEIQARAWVGLLLQGNTSVVHGGK